MGRVNPLDGSLQIKQVGPAGLFFFIMTIRATQQNVGHFVYI
jgi:hypothetical protein